MTKQAFVNAFVKRAAQYGYTGPELIQHANNFAKEAGMFDAPDPNQQNPGIWDIIKDQMRLALPGGKEYYQSQQARMNPGHSGLIPPTPQPGSDIAKGIMQAQPQQPRYPSLPSHVVGGGAAPMPQQAPNPAAMFKQPMTAGQ